MTKTVLGIVANRESAEKAIKRLKGDGYYPKDISIVMKDRDQGKILAEDTSTNIIAGTVSGVSAGAILGGLAGLVSGMVIPGLGAFFIGGPIAAGLGLAGTAASAVSGAATGALAGGILGALTGWGLSEEDAKLYESKVNKGGILIAVPARSGEENNVQIILAESGAEEVKAISLRNPKSTNPSGSFIGEDSNKFAPSYAYGASKGGKASSIKTSRQKGRGRGWHGDSEGHAIAGSGSDVPGRG